MKKTTISIILILLSSVLFFLFSSQRAIKLNPAAGPDQILGPYHGSIVDAESGEPLKGAYVLIYWEKLVPHFEISTETIAARGVESDEKGGYFIPSLSWKVCNMCRFESTTFIVYHPGYRAFIGKSEQPGSFTGNDPDFDNGEGKIRLERIPPGFDHKKHINEIDRALWGIDNYPYSYPQKEDPHMTWERLLDINMRGTIEKNELLRRVSWEYALIPEDYRL